MKKYVQRHLLNRSFVTCHLQMNGTSDYKCSLDKILESDTMLSLLPIKDSTGTRWVPEFNEIKKLIYT